MFPLEQSFPSRPRQRLLVNPGEGKQRGYLCIRKSDAGIIEYVSLLRAGAVYSLNGIEKEFPGGSCVKSSSGMGFGTAKELEANWCGRNIMHSPAMRLERQAGLASLGAGWRRNSKEGRPNGTASSWSCTFLKGQ